MGKIRVTVLLDVALAEKVRQMFGGNLSKGVNSLLHKHFFEEKKESAFGLLKGMVSVKDLEELEREEENLHADLYC
ncbi:hypothetical protein HZC09_02260 [Candidatus Micrarchaeota archaeon]|nr:hypothetical protein [Candidatus Micrarchaeota archaeon]